MSKKNEELKAKARALYEQEGFSLADIARKLNKPASTIKTWKQRGKWVGKNPCKRGRPKKKNIELKSRAKDLYEQGYWLVDIADELGVKVETIRSWKKRENWYCEKPHSQGRMHKDRRYNPGISNDNRLEKELEDFFCKEVKKAGGRAYKFVSPGCNGVPDRIVLFPGGKIAFVELKRPDGTGRLSEVQIKELDFLELLGQRVFVLDSFSKVEETIDLIKNG